VTRRSVDPPRAIERFADDIEREVRRASRVLDAAITDDECARKARIRLDALRFRETALRILLEEARVEFHDEITRLLALATASIDRLELALQRFDTFGPAPSV
jgi:hypothetical protein